MKKFCLLLVQFLLWNSGVIAQKNWEQKASVSSQSRYNAIGFSLNGKGYIGLGEVKSGTVLNDLWEYDPIKDSWTQKASYPGAGRVAATAFVANGKAYVGFGYNSSSSPQKDLWEFDPSSNKWTQKKSIPGSARFGAGCMIINDTAFIGTGSAGGSPYLSDMWMYVPATDAWVQKANFPGTGRLGSRTFTIGNNGYMGTGLKSGPSVLKDMWKYDKRNDKWSSIADFGGSAITGGVCFAINNKGYIGTGFNLSNYLKDFYSYDETANTWTKLDSIPSSFNVRQAGTVFTIGDVAYLGTGQASSGATFSDIWSFSLCDVTIIDQPKDFNANLNTSAKFSTNATGKSLSYKWQIDDGTGFKDISNSGQYSGAQTMELNVNSVNFSNNHNDKFRCIVKGPSCDETTESATLTVNCNPLLGNDPKAVNSANGTDVNFNVSTKYLNVDLKWQEDKGSGFSDLSEIGQYSGTDKDTLKIKDLILSNNNAIYRCLAYYGGCYDTSKNASLSVYCNPILNNQPSNISVYNTTDAQFGLTAYDNGTQYQWQRKVGSQFQNLSNAGQYSGTTSDSLKITNTNLSNKNQIYRCILSYKSCTDTSQDVVLDVLCKDLLNKNPVSKTAVEGSNITFDVSSYDPSATFAWQTNLGFGFQNLNNAGQYSNVGNDTLSITNLSFANDNQLFRCIVSQKGCSDTSEQATLKVICKPLLEESPVNKTADSKSNVFFTVKSFDSKTKFTWQTDLGLGFQNMSNAGQYKGVNSDTLFINNLTSSNDNQNFRCLLSLGNCEDTTQIAVLTVKLVGVANTMAKTIEIYPNPNKGIFTLNLGQLKDQSIIEIFDKIGQKIYETKTEQSQVQIVLDPFPGIYLVRVLNQEKTYFYKIQVQN